MWERKSRTAMIYQGCSNEFKIGATVWKHRMYEREHRRCEARIQGHAPPGKFLKSVTSRTDSFSLFLV